MNFIRHIRAAFELLALREDATPHHVSLYVALFSLWNEERFPTSVMLVRSEMMRAAHIGSASTYLKCLRELTDYGLITYMPSKSEHRPSRCLMHELIPGEHGPKMVQAPILDTAKARTKNGSTTTIKSDATTGSSRRQAVVSFDKHIKTKINIDKPFLSVKHQDQESEEFDVESIIDIQNLAKSSQNPIIKSEDCALNVEPKKSETPRPARSRGVSFANSEIADYERFVAAFADTDYEVADLRYYHEKIASWRQKGEVPLRCDWLATSKIFIKNDADENRLKLAPGIHAYQPRNNDFQSDHGIPVTGYRSTRFD